MDEIFTVISTDGYGPEVQATHVKFQDAPYSCAPRMRAPVEIDRCPLILSKFYNP